jgi:hypothetical protein
MKAEGMLVMSTPAPIDVTVSHDNGVKKPTVAASNSPLQKSRTLLGLLRIPCAVGNVVKQ